MDMEIWQNQIKLFLSQSITANEFVMLFNQHWSEVWGNKLPPNAEKTWLAISKALDDGKLSDEEYQKRFSELQSRYSIVWPSPKEYKIIERLFWAAEDYEHPDPKYYITETQLREAAERAFDELNQLS